MKSTLKSLVTRSCDSANDGKDALTISTWYFPKKEMSLSRDLPGRLNIYQENINEWHPAGVGAFAKILRGLLTMVPQYVITGVCL